jgi:hypothetical protein
MKKLSLTLLFHHLLDPFFCLVLFVEHFKQPNKKLNNTILLYTTTTTTFPNLVECIFLFSPGKIP